jgi:cysteine desulfurase family protein (TIGR01976 family)
MNIESIRAAFPALSRTHNDLPVAYFDAPGGTQVPRVVGEAMTDYLYHHNANTHWPFPSSAETDAMLLAAREAAADFLNASPGEIVFGNNMTTLNFHLGRALGRTWQAGDEVIVTDLDHHANVAPWRALEVDRGIVVRNARFVDEQAQLDYEHLASLVTKRTKLIAVGGASNATGTINDLERVAAIAKAAGALLFVDAVHLAPHELVDVRRIGCDFLACSSYKFYGPHARILFARRELLESLPFPKLAPASDDAPDRAETGTQNHEGIAGIAATIEFLASLGGAEGTRRERLARSFADLHEDGLKLTRILWEGLSAIPKLRLYGPSPERPRTPTVTFTIEGICSTDVASALAERAIFASNGDFYAQSCVQQLNPTGEGLVRIGCACYTSEDEVRRLVDEVARIGR